MGGSHSGARQCGFPGSLLGAVGEPRADRQRWGWPRAETPRRDYETRPAESPAHSSAPGQRRRAVLRFTRTWAGPRKPPRASAALPGEPGGGPSRRAWQPPWTVRNRAFPFARRLFAGKEAGPGILRPQPSSEIRRSTPPVPIFLLPKWGWGLGCLPIVVGGNQEEGWRIFF